MMPEHLELLRQALRYDPETGEFFWKIVTHGYWGMISPGDRAGSPKDGYVQIIFQQRKYRRARLAWLFMTGEFPPKGLDVDHIDTNRSNDRWANLRLLTRSRNNRNTIKLNRSNTTGYRGVHRQHNGTWFARIIVDGELIHLGTYKTIEEARAARLAADERFPVVASQ